jgi:hypothetical protein
MGTIDQKLFNSSATGTAITRYVHPDHLGSANVVTDASGTIAQLLDYYPYGATRVSSTTWPLHGTSRDHRTSPPGQLDAILSRRS